MSYRLVDRKLLERVGVLCPVCGSTKVNTRRDNTRRCERCGEEWKKKEVVKEEEEE